MDVSVIIPTYNERENVRELYKRLTAVLKNEKWEVIFSDDNSPDGTSEEVRQLAGDVGNVRCLQRARNRGLSAAVCDGVEAAHGDFVVVMDGDLQHDETIVSVMLDRLRAGVELVSGTRFENSQETDGLASKWRNRVSNMGNKVVRLVLGRDLTDPLTGFFAAKRNYLLGVLPKLSASGFKIYFDILFYSRKARVEEIGFTFRKREHGESKLQPIVYWQMMQDLISKMTFGIIPARLVGFLVVGLVGACLHFAILFAALQSGTSFWIAQLMATLFALVFNFTLNNILTFADKRLEGSRFFTGIFKYILITIAGIAGNVGISSYSFETLHFNVVIAALFGIMIDVIWRFTATRALIWK